MDLESDHPGFNDLKYRARRGYLAGLAQNHTWDKPIAKIDYTPEETKTWTTVWDQMEPLWEKYACQEYKVRSQKTVIHIDVTVVSHSAFTSIRSLS